MDELASYFANAENAPDRSKDAITQSSVSSRNHRRKPYALPRPVSMCFSSTATSDMYSSALSEIPEMSQFEPVDSTPSHSFGLSRTRVRSSASVSEIMPNQLPPEVEVGNIEYKRKLVNPTPSRFEHLVTQMKWRLNEGSGEAIYRLGVEDDGHVAGLAPFELASSLATLERMASRLNATIHLLRERTIDANPNSDSCQNNLPEDSRLQPLRAMELLVRQTPLSNHGKPSVCIAVLGAVDVGKSTLIGVLTDGELDNSRGRARLNLFRHLHEVQSGRTSCLSSELLGFDAAGNVTNYKRTDGRLNRSSIDELIRGSSQLVTLLDSAGHSKYQRTTLGGLSRAFPVGVLLVVSATAGLTAIGLDHAQLAYTLGLPMAVVISKIDQLVSDSDRQRQLSALYRQITLRFNQLKQSLPGGPAADSLTDPLFFPISAVTGEGLEKLLRFLHNVGSRAHAGLLGPSFRALTSQLGATMNKEEQTEPDPGEETFIKTVCQLVSSGAAAYRSPFVCLWVSEVFTCVPGVPDPVVFGMVKSGQLAVGHFACLGPDHTGEFHFVQVMSLRHNHQPHSNVFAGQTASVAVRFLVNQRANQTGYPTTKADADLSPPPVEKRRTPGAELMFAPENDENALENTPDNSFTFPHDSLLPMAPRRGMVLLSHHSWGASYDDLVQAGSSIPFRAPHVSRVGQSVGVAWAIEIEVLQRLSIFPGLTASPVVLPPLPITKQKVGFYAGCVAQPMLVLVEADCAQTSDEPPKIQLRFTRNPEYIEVGRQCILTWASCAKAVGRVSRILELYPPNPPCYQIPCWISCRAQLTKSFADTSASSDLTEEPSTLWLAPPLTEMVTPSTEDWSVSSDKGKERKQSLKTVMGEVPSSTEGKSEDGGEASTTVGSKSPTSKRQSVQGSTKNKNIDKTICDVNNARRKSDTSVSKHPTYWRRRRRKDR